jgi:uncharacterized linocin/CFP29 family protein
MENKFSINGTLTGNSTAYLSTNHYLPANYSTIISTDTNQFKIHNMQEQVKVAAFHVKRNKDNEIISSTIIDELWIEKKPGVSIDYAVAKAIKGDYEPSEIVIKEIYSIKF